MSIDARLYFAVVAAGPVANFLLAALLCAIAAAWDLRTGCSLSGQPDLATYPVRIDDDKILLGD